MKILLLLAVIPLSYLYCVSMLVLSEYFCYKLGFKTPPMARPALSAPADFLAEFAARYRFYWEQENKKAREAEEQRKRATMEFNASGSYLTVAEMLQEAINNTADITHLKEVSAIRQLYERRRFSISKAKLGLLRYHAWRFKGFNVAAEDVRRILQDELNRICDFNCHEGLTIHVSFLADETVIIKIAQTKAFDAVRAKMVMEAVNENDG
jgi:hypothetical protein